jgi:hypothetical protein
VKWTKNYNAKSTNLILESKKSQWETLPWLVEWIGSPPWLNVKIKANPPPHGPLKPVDFSAGDFFPLTRDFCSKNHVFFKKKLFQG